MFFPAAGVFAALAIPLWFVAYSGADLGQPTDPYLWHRHEMIFGYLPAALAGFLLTAIPNWTGRKPITGLKLLVLFILWLAARIVIVFDFDSGAAVSTEFLLVLAAIALHEVFRGGNRRNLPICLIVILFALANGMVWQGEVSLGHRFALGLALMMMALIGGRVTPAFTRNWLKAQGITDAPAEFDGIDRAALALTLFAALSWIIAPDHTISAVFALLAACALLVRMLRWKGTATRHEPLLLALHLAYLWLPLSLMAMAMTGLSDQSASLPIHAIGAGAIGSMTLVVMIRAILGHSGRQITGNYVDWLLIGCVHIGALMRVAVAMGWDAGLHLAGTLWPLGFLIFVVKYTPIAFAPRQD